MTSRRRAAPRKGRAPKAHKSPTSRRLLDPDPGAWALDWSLIDSEPPFGWPDQRDPYFGLLATFLARLNTRPLDEVLAMERESLGRANKDIDPEDLSGEGAERWAYIFQARGLDRDPYVDPNPAELTYCLGRGDPRRVWVVLDAPQRKMYPLWWDPEHAVLGSDGRGGRPNAACVADCLHDPDPE